MKNLFLVLLLVVATNCFAQKDLALTSLDTPVSYNGIVNVNGVTKEELFIRGRDWFSNNLHVLEIQDNQVGEISGKDIVEGKVTFRMLGSHNANATFNFNANIWVKDGRYMYRITNINNTAITYADATSTSRNDFSAPVGILYTSDHSKAKVLGLSQTKSDETYQSAKKDFDKIAKDLIASLTSDMMKSSTPDF